jgi:hypothetical protein
MRTSEAGVTDTDAPESRSNRMDESIEPKISQSNMRFQTLDPEPIRQSINLPKISKQRTILQ